MFLKGSRYLKLPDEVTRDAFGRTISSKAWRPVPDSTGTFLHTIGEIDRLDHLAYKYYRQATKWWRICDANAEFMPPQALLGKEPVATVQFALSFGGEGNPPWHLLLKALSGLTGVEDVLIGEEVNADESSGYTINITYNRMNLVMRDIAAVITNLNAGFTVGEPLDVGRIGKRIVIPPDVAG